MGDYVKRYIDKKIASFLEFVGAIYLQGPKACGKTTTCKQFARSVIEMDDPDKSDNYKMVASTQPSLLLDGDKPLLIDEWQVETKLWNAVRKYVDRSNQIGLFLLTGSVTPIFDKSMHSGTGRIARLQMYTMSLWESGDSNGKVSLSSLIANEFELRELIESPQKTLIDIAHLICRGGWPQMFKSPSRHHLGLADVYLQSLLDSDIKDYVSIKKNQELALTILKSYARAISTTTLTATIIKDVTANYPDRSTSVIRKFISAFEKLFVIIQTPAWNTYLKSRTTVRCSPKKDFVDPSIATSVLKLKPELLVNDMFYFSRLFESLVRRDLRVYASYLDGSLCHYRDRFGLECDNILVLGNGYALIEVKLGANEIEGALKNIRKIIKLLEVQKKQAPLFSMVVIPFGLVSLTRDGIWIVPVGCLQA